VLTLRCFVAIVVYFCSLLLPVLKYLEQIFHLSVGLLVSVVVFVPDFGIRETSSLHNVLQTIQ